MKHFLPILFCLLTFLARAQTIEVSDVQQEGTNLRVFYNFTGGSDSYIVSLFYSLDDGKTWEGPAKTVFGYVGKNIKPGPKKSIVWNVLADREKLVGTAIRFKVKANSEANTVIDIDGNVYQTVKIGTQIWMKENLKTTRYRNGDLIQSNLNNEKWEEIKEGAFCFYQNTSENVGLFGLLYNWYSISDPKGLCPAGWNVPKLNEINQLVMYLGGNQLAGGKLKAISGLWNKSSNPNSQEIGFSGLPGGHRSNNGTYLGRGFHAYFWTSSEVTLDQAQYFSLFFNNLSLNINSLNKGNGFSVRCLKEQ